MAQCEVGLSRTPVAFLGPNASYTHQAALNYFGDASQYSLDPQITIEDVFASVQSSRAGFGVVPFENSSNGSVVFTLDLFADREQKFPDLVVVGEVYVPVRHCLLGRKRLRATTGPEDNYSSSVAHITKLYSHPQAWGQCKKFLNTHLKGIERQDVSSTSRAAELVAAENQLSSTSAAISSKIAAEATGLDILVEGIEDNAGNATRFLVLQRKDQQSNRSAGLTAVDHPKKTYKSLLTFTVAHDSPGALADSLAVFKKHGLNLTSINTRPSGETAWHYIFFVEFLGGGHGGAEGEGDAAVKAALQDLHAVASDWRWLGSWEDALAKEGAKQ